MGQGQSLERTKLDKGKIVMSGQFGPFGPLRKKDLDWVGLLFKNTSAVENVVVLFEEPQILTLAIPDIISDSIYTRNDEWGLLLRGFHR